MDIVSHGFWAAAAAKGINIKKNSKINLYWTAFWGVFPDLFAFAPATVWLVWLRFKGINAIPIRPENADALEASGGGPFALSYKLYNYSHSLIVMFAVVGLVILYVYLRNKKVTVKDLPLAMIGWPLHILIDIPTHSYKFYPTPFLWPLSNWKFNGFSWGQPWFMVLDITALVLVFRYLKKKELNKKTAS